VAEQVDISTILSSYGARIKDIQERGNMLKERVLVLGQSFLKQEDDIRKDVAEIKDELKELRLDTERVKERVENLIAESENFARREELRIVEKQMKLWEPLKFVKIDEVKSMIEEAFEKHEAPHETKKHNKNYIN